MQKIISTFSTCLLLMAAFSAQAQENKLEKWRFSVQAGQYSAKIGMPSFEPFRLGLQGNASYQYNQNPKHQLRQSLHVGAFTHRYLQTAIQVYTEFQYEFHFGKSFYLNPLAIGAGYVASFSDMTTLKWNGTEYEEVKVPMRNNFLVSLGPNLGYESAWKVANRPLTLSVGYRLQVQGIMIKEAVPVIAYSSWQLGAGIPLSVKSEK